jgi:predicted nucleic acid-binding protein
MNASPLIMLGKINRLDLAERLATRLLVPQAVIDEVAGGRQDPLAQAALKWALRLAPPCA